MNPFNRLSEDEFARLVQRAAAMPDALPALVRAAIGQWREVQPSSLQSIVQSVLNRVTALLNFDSWEPAAQGFGVRSVASDTRHLLFSAQGRDVDVRIAPTAGHFALTGQILGPDVSGVVELTAAGDNSAETPDALFAELDPLGEFRLDGIRNGTYVLILRLSGDEIVLPPIEVGERRN